MEGASGFDRLQDRDDVMGCGADCLRAVNEIFYRRAFFQADFLGRTTLRLNVSLPDGGSLAVWREWRGLRNLIRGRNVYGQAALQDRAGTEAHVASENDCARASVDDDLGDGRDVDGNVFNFGEQSRNAIRSYAQRINCDAAAIDGVRDTIAKDFIDGDGCVVGNGEVGIVEQQRDRIHVREIDGNVAFDDGAVGDHGDGSSARQARAPTLPIKAA